MEAWKAGDAAGIVYVQPGNDTTYLVLTEVREHDASAWDVVFEFALKTVQLSKLWHPTERELDSTISFSLPRRSGTFTVRQLIDEAKQKL